MSQQSQNQQDTDALAKNYEAYVRGQKKVDIPDFKTPDASYPEPRANLAPDVEAAQPSIGQTIWNDNPPAKEATPAYENGVVDAPAGMNPTAVQADAKRDAGPDKKPTLVNADQSCDT